MVAMTRTPLFLLAALGALSLGTLAGCDSGFGGEAFGNAAPDTELSVRSVDLREDLGNRRLVSTVVLAWSGVDPDGVVVGFDVRAYSIDAGQPTPGPEEGWTRTTRRDSTILLPIPLGQRTGDVAVEVRAVDNDGALDETPARTVFPIINSNPSFRLTAAEAPPDTTWPVLSFAFAASDPDGAANLAGIEIALNDSTGTFARIPADATFVTLVAEDPSASVTGARIFIGRGFQNAEVTLPGLRLDDDNTVYLRAVDAAGATSRLATYPDADGGGVLFVRRVTSPVLLVNDIRSNTATSDTRPLGVAREALALHGTLTYDVWDLSRTPLLASSPQTSAALPRTADPTLRQTLALWSRIYWVSNAVTNSTAGNNLPLVATVTDRFFEQGGRLLVQTPITRPLSGDEGEQNPAIDLLPMSGLSSFTQDGTRVLTLRAPTGTAVSPAQPIPSTGATLPPLVAAGFLTTTLPYDVGPDDVPLLTMPFTAVLVGNTQVPWTGSQVVASIGSNGRTGLFALPLFSGAGPLFAPATPGGPGPAAALAAMLDGLSFPTTTRPAGRLASRR